MSTDNTLRSEYREVAMSPALPDIASLCTAGSPTAVGSWPAMPEVLLPAPGLPVEGAFGLSCESRAEVDALVTKALAGGGKEAGPPQDHGFMYGRSFEDLDGHHWEVMWMDPKAAQ